MPTSIAAHIGRSFEVTLYTHSGTGYLWCLTALPKGVALVDVSDTVMKPGLPGGSLRQVFTFLGTAAGGGELAFELLRSWEPEAPADKRSYTVKVTKDVEGAMKAVAGQESFPPVLVAECCGEHEDKVVLPSTANCAIPYGVLPGTGIALSYGFPVMPLYAVRPPLDGTGPIIAKYMAQPPRG